MSSFRNSGHRRFRLRRASAMLLGVGVYAWATLALGLRASNLTNRGIVTTGPYRWLRHPAYVAKNLSWWIGATPLVVKFASTRSLASGPRDPGHGGLERDLRAAGADRRATPRERSRLPGLPLPGSLALYPGVGLTSGNWIDLTRMMPETGLEPASEISRTSRSRWPVIHRVALA